MHYYAFGNVQDWLWRCPAEFIVTHSRAICQKIVLQMDGCGTEIYMPARFRLAVVISWISETIIVVMRITVNQRGGAF